MFVGYASSNGEVLDELSGKDGEFYGNNAYMPRVGYPKDEIFEYNEKTKKLISDYWTKVKNSEIEVEFMKKAIYRILILMVVAVMVVLSVLHF